MFSFYSVRNFVFYQAWNALLNSQLTNKNYLRPGITAPLKNPRGSATVTEGLESCNNSKKSSSFQRAGLSAYRNLSTSQGDYNLSYGSEAGDCGSLKHTDSSSRFSIANSKVNVASNVSLENVKGNSLSSCYSSLENFETWHTGGDICVDRNYVDATDDEILEVK